MYFFKTFLKTTTLVFCLPAFQANAQDIHFSQFYENAILRNPALTGIFSGDYKAGVNFRSQWSNIAVPFVTTLASFESRIRVNKEVGDYLSYGLTATYDRAGSIGFNSLQVYPAINYNKSLEDAYGSYLSVGFAGGYVQRSVDPTKMTFDNQWQNGGFDPNAGSGERMTFNKVQYYDLSAGVSFNSSAGSERQVNYYLGAAAYHVTQPKTSFDASNAALVKLSMKWSGNLGIQYRIDNHVGLTFHANYMTQEPYQEIILGGLVSWGAYDEIKNTTLKIYAGAFYRVKDAIIPTIKLDYDNYSFTASYDANTSGFKLSSGGTAGGFELSLYLRGVFQKMQGASDALRCPRFEQNINQPAYGY
jgi:type IX secretion system PorP/SprF family membrane protein